MTAEQSTSMPGAASPADWSLTGRRDLLLAAAPSTGEPLSRSRADAEPIQEAALSPAGRTALGVLGSALLVLAAICTWMATQLHSLRAAKRAVEEEKQDLGDKLQAVMLSEGMHRSLVDTAVDGILTGTPDGIVTGANPSALGILGRDLDSVVGKHIGVLFAPETLEEKPLRFDLFADGGIVVSEREICRPDGTRVMVEMRSRRMPNGSCQSSIRDITEGKRTREELRRKTAEMEDFFNSALDLLCIADTQGRFVRVNAEWARVLGYSVDELEHHCFLDFVHPDDLSATQAAVAQLVRQEEVFSFTNRYRCRDGSYRDIEWRSTPRGELIYAAARDVTERNRTEEALRRTQFAMDRANDGVFWVDSQSRLVYVNDAACASLGYSREELLQMRIFDFDPDMDEETMLERLSSPPDGGCSRFESRHVAKDGRVFPVEISRYYVDFDGQWFRCSFVRDITERKKVEGALRRTQFTVDQASDGVFWVDSDGRVTYVNDAACASLGYTYEQLLGMRVSDFDPAIDEVSMAEQLAELREGDSRIFESHHVARDGRVIPVEVSSSFVKFDGQWFSCCYVRDISERKRVEEAMRRTQFAVDHASDGVFWTGDDGQVLYVNDAACTSLGYSREELLRMHIGDIDIDFDQEALLDLQSKLRELGSTMFESRQITKDGRIVPVEVCANFVNFGGDSFCCAFVRDISDRKQAEEALRASEKTFRNIIEASPMGVHLYELQEDGRLVFTGANPAADRLLEVDHEQFLGLDIEEAFPALRATDIPEHYRRVAVSGVPWRTQQIDYQDGAVAGAFEVHAFQMSPGKTAALFLDIADRLRNAAQQEALQEQLHQAQKLESVGRLAGGIAHDFNNLLQAILGYAEMALLQIPAESLLREDIEEIQKVAERAADLTKQLLAFARRQTVVPKVIDLNGAVSDMLGMLRRLIGEEVRLVWTPKDGLWPVKVDPSQVGMVLANLCVNSRDAIEGTGEVIIETGNVAVDDAYCALHADAKVGDYVVLSVSDDGCGIAEDVLAEVFDPFFTTKEVDKGTGLGLATVHGIALQNGGFVTAYSEVGKGTTLRVYFPRHLQGVVPQPSQRQRSEVVGGTETVLVVEDEPALLKMCGEALERLGYRTLCANHPARALALAEEHGEEIELLVTDVVMPDMNGKELATRMRNRNPGLRCLYMSGYPEDAISHHGIVEEELHFVQKPFSRRTLAEKVREVLDGLAHGEAPQAQNPIAGGA